MSGLGQLVAQAALHVTVAAVPAVLLIAWVGRRHPAGAGTLASIALGLLAALSGAVWAPLPDAWTWNRPAAAEDRVAFPSTPPTQIETALALEVPLTWFGTLPDRPTVSRPGWSAWHVAGFVFVGGFACEAVRLALGVAAVARCRRRSRAVTVGPVFDDLRRELGVTEAVAVCESSAVGTAATAGWRRPAVLLAPDWRDWPAADLRAVLAHELAHVRRRDYLTGLLARLCQLANFYHPLARWLAARQRFAQELAADALAAPLAGGRGDYLRSLARLALRQDARPSLARPFFTDRNGLTRRIAMLKVTDDVRRTPVRLWLAGAGILAAALAASALRAPAHPGDDAQTPVRPAPPLPPLPEPALPATPLALEHLPAEADGFVAVRPALLLSRPDMKPLLDAWSAQINHLLRSLGFGPGFVLPLETIDQVVGPVTLKTYSDEEMKQHPTTNGGRNTLMASVVYMRMTRDTDWVALFNALPPVLQMKQTKPNEFQVTVPGTPVPLTLTAADARTLVLGQLPGKTGGVPASDRWGGLRQKADQAGFAVVLDNRAGKWGAVRTEEPEVAAVAAMLGHARKAGLFLKWEERVQALVEFETANRADADAIAASKDTLYRTLDKSLGRKADGTGFLSRFELAWNDNNAYFFARSSSRVAEAFGRLSLQQFAGDAEVDVKSKP